jgi:hypothetical protein
VDGWDASLMWMLLFMSISANQSFELILENIGNYFIDNNSICSLEVCTLLVTLRYPKVSILLSLNLISAL